MAKNYYIDESGSTGDLTRSGCRFDFGKQQIFTLAALGVDDNDALSHEILRLKARHGIYASELKSTSARAKPRLISDLANYIRKMEIPLMIEVVDKRFMIAVNMINTLIMRPLGTFDFSPEAQYFRNFMAEYISASAPSKLFESFVTACDVFSAANLTTTFEVLMNWLAGQPISDDVAAGIRKIAIDSFADFEAIDPKDESSQRRFLPIPDQGKRGQSVWMLPNLTSFTNIYARINRRHARRIKDVTLFHDENAQFDEILRAAKQEAEELKEHAAVPLLPFADYHFEEKAKLIFAGSHASPGIQASDVLAGFIMRYVRDILYSEHPPYDQADEAFFDILALSEPTAGTGINFVLPTSDVIKLGVTPAQGGI